MRFEFASIVVAAALTACGGYVPVSPVTPTPPGPVVPPTPVDPVVVGHGAISPATFAAITVGMTEAEVLALTGAPYQRRVAAGSTVLEWDIVGAGIAWVFLVDGKVTRRASL